ncbi:MAG: hypothetical protein CUN55_07070 [Phototrophicales bacterium]|nr:MAG: hypothetical protein CUN55_07070 [Phototrophicales bacterium]
MSDHIPPTVSPPPSLPEDTRTTGAVRFHRRWECPRCGSDDLASAYLLDYGDGFQPVYLAPRRLKIKRLRNFLRPFKHLTKVDADVCRTCGMVILEVNTEEFEEAEKRFGRS